MMEPMKDDGRDTKHCMEQEYKLYWRRWLVLAMFSFTVMISNSIWISFSTITSIVKTYYQVDPIFINWLSITYSLFIALHLAPGAYLVSRFGLRWTMVVGAFVNALGSCFRLIGAGRTMFVFVFIGSCLCGLAECFFLFLSPHIAAAWFGAHERTLASSIGMLLCWSGVGLGFLTGTFFVSERHGYDEIGYGIRNLLLFEATTSTVLFLICVALMKDAPPTPPSRSQEVRFKTVNATDHSASTSRSIRQDHMELTATNNESTSKKNESIQKETSDPAGYRTFQRERAREKAGKTVPSFTDSLMSLFRDKQFHLLCQAYAIYSGSNFTYTTVLNQITVFAFPGKEEEIGYMGFASLMSGLLSMFLSGVFLNRTKRFKVFTIAVFSLAVTITLLLTIALRNNASIQMAFALYIIFGFFTYPYMSAGLEYVAEVTYPVPEILSSSICLLLASCYAVVLTQIIGMELSKGINVGGYIISGLYLICLLLAVVVKSPLKRSSEDNVTEMKE